MNKLQKFIVSTTLSIIANLLAWIGPIVVTFIMYHETIYGTKIGPVLIPLVIVTPWIIRSIWHRLSVAIDQGVAMEKEIAREIRFLIPMVFILAAIFVFSMGLANFHILSLWMVVLNVAAIPFRLGAYRLSLRYERDMAAIKSTESLVEIAKKIGQ